MLNEQNTGKNKTVTVLTVISAVFAVTGYVLIKIYWANGFNIIPLNTEIERFLEMLISVIWFVFIIFFSKKGKCTFLLPSVFLVNMIINIIFLISNIINIIDYSSYGYTVGADVFVNIIIQLAMISVCVMAASDYFKKYRSRTFTVIAVICICIERAYYLLSDMVNIVRFIDQYNFNIATLSFYLRTVATVITYIAVLNFVLRCEKNSVYTES